MKEVWIVLEIIAMGFLCGFVANGIFWWYQQVGVFPLSFNIVVGGFTAGLLGYGIAMVSFILRTKGRTRGVKRR